MAGTIARAAEKAAAAGIGNGAVHAPAMPAVLSPSTRKFDPMGKRPVYAREKIAHLWLVDPLVRTLEAFELRDGEWTPVVGARDDDLASIRPFDAVSFSLANLWS